MYTPPTLPYCIDSSKLQLPLPTLEEIHAATTIIKGGDQHASKTVVVLRNYFLVKYGKCLERIEGDNLLFIEQNLQIPAPRLYAMWEEEDGKFYLVMEFTPGTTLEELWGGLQDSERTVILGKLKAIFDQMHSLPAPGFYGSVSHGMLPYHLFWAAKEDRNAQICGLFEKEEDIHTGLVIKSRLKWAFFNEHSYVADFREGHLRDFFKRHPPVFSHSDLQKKNVIVQEISSDTGKDFKVFLVDWELAGWYPNYWEYVAAYSAFIWHTDWPSRVPDIIEPWGVEAAVLKLIFDDLVS